MLPVSPDVLAWIARELGAELLARAPDGGTEVISGDPSRQSDLFEDAIARLAGPRVSPGRVLDLVRRADEGEPGGLSSDDGVPGRLLAWRDERSTFALLLPAGEREHILRRAATADLAAGVTHEVANSLTAIAGWAEMASTAGPLPERTHRALEVVQKSAKDALASARGLLRTMRNQSAAPNRLVPAASSPELTDVSSLTHEVLDTLRPELDEARIGLDVEIGGPLTAPIAPAALRLIVSNLVRNAFEALETGGRIRVSIQERGTQFILTIADDGPGMSRETLGLAFDRYFTTKTDGTGLGLALVRDTVYEAGGRVEVRSRRGLGTRFEVWLPCSDDARMSIRPLAFQTSSSGIHPKPVLLGARVLVVDDDEALRMLVKTALELQGVLVTAAAGYDAALSLGEPFDLALIDLALGDGSGDELMQLLRARGSFRVAVLMSGTTDEARLFAGVPDAVLRKPFELDELQQLLEEQLDPTSLLAKG